MKISPTLAGGQQLAAIIENARSSAPATDASDGAGFGQRVGAGGKRHRARLGGAVELMDDRSPPVDHALAYVVRAWCRRVDHELERGDIVAALDGVRQLEQTDKHGRHHEHGVDARAFDQL
mgnify:CR=1 FL=1